MTNTGRTARRGLTHMTDADQPQPRNLTEAAHEGREQGAKAARRYKDIHKCLDSQNAKSPYARRRWAITDPNLRRMWGQGFAAAFNAAHGHGVAR